MAEWNSLYVRVDSRPGWSHYYAWANGIEFRGTTMGYVKDVEEILRRMIRASREPPEVVMKTARLVFEHLERYIQDIHIFGDGFTGTAVEHEVSPYVSYTLYIEVETQHVYIIDRVVSNGKEDLGPAEPGWAFTIIAKYEGYDGTGGEAEHEVRRKVVFKGRVDPNVVWNEMVRVIRHAVNALPEE